MSRTPDVILYRYDGSPFAAKAENLLAFKGIPHYQVDVPLTLPRPDITDLLGITYRRIPLLAIGNDVHCDTSLIVSVLERHFPSENGYLSFFARRRNGGTADTGMIKAFAMYYTDRALFPLGAASLPYQKYPKSFIADRSAVKWQGQEMNVEALLARQSNVKSTISSHLHLLEEQLSDGREWLFDTEHPGYGDISVHFVHSWIQYFRSLKDVYDAKKFPKSTEWVLRVTKFLEQRKSQLSPLPAKLSGAEAAKKIASFADTLTASIEFDEVEASRLGVELGTQVEVVPDDNAKNYPTTGKLIGITREESVLEVSGMGAPFLRCHFPRLNFIVRPANSIAAKL